MMGFKRPDAITMRRVWLLLDFPDKQPKSSYGHPATSRSVEPRQKGIRDDRTETVTRVSGNGKDGDRYV